MVFGGEGHSFDVRYVTGAQAADTGGRVLHMDHNDSLKSARLRQRTYKRTMVSDDLKPRSGSA